MDLEIPSIKLVVIGEASVGKTTLVHSLARNASYTNIPPTNGCQIEILKQSVDQRPFFVELWDVGGRSRFKGCRHPFYKKVDGKCEGQLHLTLLTFSYKVLYLYMI